MTDGKQPPADRNELVTSLRKRKSTSMDPSEPEDIKPGNEQTKDEVINFQPLDKKPKFDFKPSALAASLPGFLQEMRRENEALSKDKEAGKLGAFEILEASDSGENGEDESSEDEEGSTKERVSENRQSNNGKQYIEMELGLGVLEEKRQTGSSGESDSDSSSESDSDSESDESDSIENGGAGNEVQEQTSRDDRETSTESESSGDERRIANRQS